MNGASSPGRSFSVRTRAFVAFALILGSAIASSGLMDDHPKFVWLLVATLLLGGLYLAALRCPACGTSIVKRKLGGVRVWGWIWPPKRCSECGGDLSK
jgi:hypothetical protein